MTDGTSVITETMKTAISGGMADLFATVQDVLSVSVPASIFMIALTAGVSYALRKVGGVISKAQ